MRAKLSMLLFCVAVGCGGGSGGGGDEPDGGTGEPDAANLEPDAKTPVCGDGELDPGEACDDDNTESGDGCAADCATVEEGFVCVDPSVPCVVTHVCGNGLVEDLEACDDQNTVNGDGCNADCGLEPGWRCDTPGIRCSAAACGDGIVAGFEECDDANNAAAGCSATCELESGFQCLTPGAACTRTTCGNNVTEGTEQCDDMNNDLGDGCTPLCTREPQCTDGTCLAVCGDGAIQDGEACDDGNLRNYDGCSSTCVVEVGFACTPSTSVEPAVLNVPIVYRDFKGNDLTAAGNAHSDFQNYNGAQKNMTNLSLNASKKPTLRSNPTVNNHADHVSIRNATTFGQWYSDSVYAKTVVETLPLTRTAPGTYVYESSSFFPLTDRGWQDPSVPAGEQEIKRDGKNFSFTSELRYWFKWAGNEDLEFKGDDDVWVYVNGKLAVDLGGVHGVETGTVRLDAATNTARALGMEIGKTYEVVVFQAERHTGASNYKLTLKGFNTQRSVCNDTCGDAVTSSQEQCDDGFNDGAYGHCGVNCTFGPRCGDGVVQGTEVCDDGTANNTGAYGKCKPNCELGPRCGDSIVQTDKGETCDDGNNTDGDGCPGNCVGIIL